MPDEVTWVGHSTVALNLGGTRVLSDPLLTRRVAHLRRRTPDPDPEVARCDLVVVSHAHRDHLHRRSLRRVASAAPGVEVIGPPGSGELLDGLGLEVIHLPWPGEQRHAAGVRVLAVPAVHPGGRGPRPDPRMPAVGHVLEHAGRRVYLAGDTDLFPGMSRLGELDLAVLPIAGWWRTLGEGHLDPDRAAEAVRRLDPALVLPVHWGTFAPETGVPRPGWMDRPAVAFREALERRGLSDRLLALEPGESATF